VTTDDEGLAVTELTNTLAGTSRIQATLSNGRNNQIDINFTADASTAAMVTLVVLNNGEVIDTQPIGLFARVTDAYGNPVPSHPVTFTANNGATITSVGRTDHNGSVLAEVNSTIAGDSTVIASTNGTSQTTNVTFVAGDRDSGTLTVLADEAVADGVSTNRVQARVVDSHNNPVPNQMVTFSVVSGGASVVTATVNTDSNGQAVTDLTSTTAGSSDIRGTLAGGSFRQVTVNFLADSSTATITAGNLKILDDNAVANGVATNEVEVIVTDAYGNPVPGQPVTFTASNSATVLTLGMSNAAGVVIATLTSTTAGISRVTATVNSSSQSADTTFVADASTATITGANLTVLEDNSIANGVATNRVQALVTDAFDNPVPGQAVTFTANNGATITHSGPSDANGVVSATLTNTSAGVSTVTATINGSSLQINTLFVAGVPDAINSSMAAEPPSIMANDQAISTLRFTVKDTHGNAVTGLGSNVGFVVTGVAGTTLGTIVESPSGSGVYQASLKGTTEGVATVTPHIGGFQLGALSAHVSLTVPWTSLTVSPSTAFVLPGRVEQFTATAVRNGANIDVTEQVVWTSSDPAVATVSNAIGTKGRVTGAVGGTVNITASYGGFTSNGVLTVSTVTLSRVFGQARSGDHSKLYQVDTDNQLAFRCGAIVDAMGTPAQGLVGGSGGAYRTASVNNVTSVDVEWGTWSGNPGGVSITKLTLRYSGGTPTFVCGQSSGVTAIQRDTWTVPSGSSFKGFNVSARTFVHEMQFSSQSNPL